MEEGKRKGDVKVRWVRRGLCGGKGRGKGSAVARGHFGTRFECRHEEGTYWGESPYSTALQWQLGAP